MNLLIVEPEIKGHFISLYVRKTIKAYKKDKVFLLTSKKIFNSKILGILKKDHPNLKILITDELVYSVNKNPFNLFVFQFLNFIRIKKKIKKFDIKYNFSHIFFTNFDHFDKVLCFFNNPFNSKYFSGILVNPRAHHFYKKSSRKLKYLIYKNFLHLLIKNKFLKKIFTNDILFYNFSKKIFLSEKINYFNEPVELENPKEKIPFSIPKNKTLKILVYGSIRLSKSLEELIFLIKKLDQEIKIKVTIAGIHEKDVKKILSQKNLTTKKLNNNIKIINKFISPTQEMKLFTKTNIVWCVYKNTPHGSSSVFYLSNLYRKPVVTNEQGLIGWYNKKNKLGPILNFNDSKESLKSVKTILNLYKKKKIYTSYCKNQLKFNKIITKQKKFYEIVRNMII